MTQTDVDGKIGRRRGYLSHVFQRRVDLKVVDLLQALKVLGIEPGRFFAAVVESGSAANSGLLHLIADPSSEGRAPDDDPEAAEGDLEERVRQALQTILADLRQGKAARG